MLLCGKMDITILCTYITPINIHMLENYRYIWHDLSVIMQLAWFGRDAKLKQSNSICLWVVLIKRSVFQTQYYKLISSSRNYQRQLPLWTWSVCQDWSRLCVSRSTRKTLSRRVDILKIWKRSFFPVYLDTWHGYYRRLKGIEQLMTDCNKAMFSNSSKTSHFMRVYKWLRNVFVTCYALQLRYFVETFIFGYTLE